MVFLLGGIMREELVPKEPLTKKTRLHLSVDSETKDKAEAYCRGVKVTISRLFQETIERVVNRQQLTSIKEEFSDQLKMWNRIGEECQAIAENAPHVLTLGSWYVRIAEYFPELEQANQVLAKMRQMLAEGGFWCAICGVRANWDHFEPDLDKFKRHLDLLTRELRGFEQLRELRDKWIELIDFRRAHLFRKGRLLEEKETVIVEDSRGVRYTLDEVDHMVWELSDSSLSAAEVRDQIVQLRGYSPDEVISSIAGLVLWKLLGEAQEEQF